MCPLVANWNGKIHYNTLKDPVPKGVLLFCNPPYSKTAAFIRRCCELYFKGHNIVMMIPACSAFSSEFTRKVLQRIAKIVGTPLSIFKLVDQNETKNHEMPSLMTLALVYLIPPNVSQEGFFLDQSDPELVKQVTIVREELISNGMNVKEADTRVRATKRIIRSK